MSCRDVFHTDMRIWDVPPRDLCRNHLLGEHRELHALWSILISNKAGYRNHPETKRWIGKLKALYDRHEAEVTEMTRRNYKHNSPLSLPLGITDTPQTMLLSTIAEQKQLLHTKPCPCYE